MLLRSTVPATAAVTLGVCLIIACMSVTFAGSPAVTELEPSAGAVSHLKLKRGDFTTQMLLTGELLAEDAVALIAPDTDVRPLRIRWLANDGAEVRQGDKIVEFDNSQLVADSEKMRVLVLEAVNELGSIQARVADDEARAIFEMERHRAALDKARLDAEVPAAVLAKREYEKRHLDLRRAELDFAEAERKLRITREAGRAEVAIQRIAIKKAQIAVDRAETGIEALCLRAPRAGILILGKSMLERRPFQVGDAVWPGEVVARLPDLSTLIVAARLFDVDDGRVQAGQAVHVTLDAFPEQTFSGRIREIDRIAEQADRFSLRRFFRIKIDLETIELERMRPGMSVKVVVQRPPLQGVLLAPRPSLDWGEPHPRARLADGSLVPLTLGPCSAVFCVVEEGLRKGTALGRVSEVSR